MLFFLCAFSVLLSLCAHAGVPAEAVSIDEDLHSRQLAVYGRETMRRLFGASVLISGLNGLGVEVGESSLEQQDTDMSTCFGARAFELQDRGVATSSFSVSPLELQGCGSSNHQSVCSPFLCCRYVHSAKNVILAGVKAVTLHDTTTVQQQHLSAQFFLSEADVGKNRAEACAGKLQELNTAVAVSVVATEISEEHLAKFQVR